MRRALPMLLLLTSACEVPPPVDDDPAPTDPTPDAIEAPLAWATPPLSCADPAPGFDRFTDAAHGVSVPMQFPLFPRSGVIARDLDRDGDVDLVFDGFDGPPQVFANDGQGEFTAVEGIPEPGMNPWFRTGAPDLDGDGFPDLLGVSVEMPCWMRGRGGLAFDLAQCVSTKLGHEDSRLSSFSWGDIDGDGDIDLALPGTPRNGFQEATEEARDHLLFNDGNGYFAESWSMPESGPKASSVISLFTDRDGDRDLDLYWATHAGFFDDLPARFLRNDGPDAEGLPVLVDDTSEIAFDDTFSAMGVDSADLNADGLLDYCFTDGRLQCYLSGPGGAYFEAGTALGLEPDSSMWAGWSVDLADLDNDGDLDAVAAGATCTGCDAANRNQVWEGDGDVFVRRTETHPFGAATDEDMGVVTADLDGDGALEVVTHGGGGARLWWNTCTAGAWLQIRLVGHRQDVDAVGTQVAVAVGDTVRVRETQGSRGSNQGPAALHFGLGDVDLVDRIEVRWLDGTTSVLEDLEPRRRLTIAHPEATEHDWLPYPGEEPLSDE